MAFDTIPTHSLCESNISYIYTPEANTEEIIDGISAIQYSFSIQAVITTRLYL